MSEHFDFSSGGHPGAQGTSAHAQRLRHSEPEVVLLGGLAYWLDHIAVVRFAVREAANWYVTLPADLVDLSDVDLQEHPDDVVIVQPSWWVHFPDVLEGALREAADEPAA